MSDRWSVLHLQEGDLQLTLLPGIGGRLWDVEFQGHSVLFQNPDLEGLAVDEARLADLPTRSPQFGFPLWGGEKTWIAPDSAWTQGAPFPVLDSGAYKVTTNDSTQIEMTSAICPVSHLSVTRRIALASANGWTIDHSVTNHGTRNRLTGIWSVMMLDTPAQIGFAMDTPEYHLVFGSAEGMVTTTDTCVVADCARQQEFKIGLPNPEGTTLVRCGKDGPWLTCSVPKPEQGDAFAHTHPVEVFNSGDHSYCEAEWHSPVRDLGPKESLSFQQTFHVSAGAGAPKSQKELFECMS